MAISNSRLISADADTVALRWKDYRIKTGDRQKVMRLATDEFILRFLLLPDGFKCIRHYGLLASAGRGTKVAMIRALLGAISSLSR
ncbi:transposase (plasmid) [Sinorhizobium americanum CCGM7]|nr:transposase [Sinorhizobium americanum CCGM7]